MEQNPVEKLTNSLMNQILDNANLTFRQAFIAGVPMDYIYDSEKEKLVIKTRYPINVIGNDIYIKASQEDLAQGDND